MIHLRVEPLDQKRIRISGIDGVVLDCLHAIPEILEQRDAPAARARLLPNPTVDDSKTNRDWERLIAPELRHIFVSAGETVARDLTGLAPDSHSAQALEVTFAAEHVNSWISALNQARLILGEIHNVSEADMNKSDFDVRRPKGLAILRIHVLGYLLQLFVELESGHEVETNL